MRPTKKPFPTLLFRAALALAVSSCSISPDVVLYNNAGFSVELQFNERRIDLAPQATAAFDSSTLWNERLVVKGGSYAVHYVPPAGEFPNEWLRTGFFRSRLVAQLEPDLAIYLLPPPLEPPQPNSIEQPSAFPLVASPVAVQGSAKGRE